MKRWKEGTVVALRKLSVSRGFRLNRGSRRGVKRPRRCEEGANPRGVRLEITGHLRQRRATCEGPEMTEKHVEAPGVVLSHKTKTQRQTVEDRSAPCHDFKTTYTI